MSKIRPFPNTRNMVARTHVPGVYQYRQHFFDADLLNFSDIPDPYAANRHQ
jgi:hypothetical protein